MRPPIPRDWANVSSDPMITEPTPVASAALLAQADLWVFTLLTSPYVGTAHLTGSSVDSAAYAMGYHINQEMTLRVAAGATGARLSMTATRNNQSLTTKYHTIWGQYDNTTTSQTIKTTGGLGSIVFQDFKYQQIHEQGSTFTTSPGAAIDRQLLIEPKKVSSAVAIRSSHHTAVTMCVSRFHEDMTQI